MVEYAEEKDGRVKFTGKEGKDNIAILGEDIKHDAIITIKEQRYRRWYLLNYKHTAP